MDTQKDFRDLFRFIILIPHRDALKPIDDYKKKLFAAGYNGAYSFPLASPLAAVSRPFSLEELKELGRNIRNLKKVKNGKILSTSTALAAYGGKFAFFGPALNLRINEEIFPKSTGIENLCILSPPVLCAALIDPYEKPVSGEEPTISFRAASLANLAIRRLDCGSPDYSFEWRIGPHVWLPKGTRENSR